MPKCLSSSLGAWVLRLALPSFLVAAGAFAAGPARAGDFSVGLGAGTGRGHVDCIASMPCDRTDTDFKLFAGYRVAEGVELRLSYFGDGRFKGGDVTPLGTEFGGTFKVSGIGLTAGYLWTFAPSWSLAGRAGLAVMRTRFDYADPFSGSVSKTTTQPLAGVSLGYAVTPALRLGLDYDVTRFKVHQTHGPMQTLGLSVQYAF